MNGLTLLCIAAACFLGGYFIYSRFVARFLGIDAARPTPAVAMKDGVDYVPAPPAVLFGHHFATIAGAGPIVGPVLAAQFGWAPVALWVILGCVFIGAVHDMIAMFLSVRHEGKSIGSVIGTVLGPQGRILFLVFCWATLILVVAEFVRQIAATFVTDPAIATASLLFIAEAVVFGLCVYRWRMGVLAATLVFVPLMFGFVWVGMAFPLDLVALFNISPDAARTVWTLLLLAYCFAASTAPVWILLQPRDYLNAYLLYAMMAMGFLGVVVARPELSAEAFAGWTTLGRSGAAECLFPFLFVTVACGACSGFHALVASGTSAKQLDSERSIRPVAYGGMLLEGLLAIVAVIGVAGTYLTGAEYAAAAKTLEPVQMFAATIAGFCGKCGIPVAAAKSFMLLAVAAFLMTSVDSGTRLARFTWQELVQAARPRATSRAARIAGNMHVGAGVAVAAAAALLLGDPGTAKSLWTIFASANQLLAALTLLTATLWFVKNRKPCAITLIPTCFMFSVSGWALVSLSLKALTGRDWVRTGATGFLMLAAAALAVFAAAAAHEAMAERKQKTNGGCK